MRRQGDDLVGEPQGNSDGSAWERGAARVWGGERGCPLWELLGVIRSLSCRPVSMMHQQAASSHYNSAQGGSQHYQGQSSIAMMGQSGQGSSMMGQRPMAPYRPSQQGNARAALRALLRREWGCEASHTRPD